MVVINYITTCTLNVRYNIFYKVSLENFSSIVTCIYLIIFCMVLLSFVQGSWCGEGQLWQPYTKTARQLGSVREILGETKGKRFLYQSSELKSFHYKIEDFLKVYCCVIFQIELFNKMILLYYMIIDCWIPNVEIVYFFFSINLHLLIIVKTLRVGMRGANYDLLNMLNVHVIWYIIA